MNINLEEIIAKAVKSLNVEEIVAKAISGKLGSQSQPDYSGEYTVGEHVLVRTVTFFSIGKIAKIGPLYLHLEDAGICFQESTVSVQMKTGEVSRFERLPDVHRVAHSAIVNVDMWNHPTPETK